MMRKTRLWVAVVVAATLLFGCSDSTKMEMGERPQVIRALWDPGEGVLPTPTDLVRDDETGRLAIPLPEDASAAERAFVAYMNELDGYPLATPIRLPVSGPVSESTLAGSVVMVKAPGDTRIRVRAHYDAERGEIVVEPGEPLQPGTSYAVALMGYERGVRGRAGEPVVSDAAFYLLRSPFSLRDHVDAVPGATRAERQELAEELALLQEKMEPAFNALSRYGVDREEVATLTMFTTTSAPAIRFDSAAGVIPMPNDLLFLEEENRVDLPIPEDAEEEERRIRQALNQYDGFSLSGAMMVRSTHGFDAQASPSAFRLFEKKGPGYWEEVTELERGIFRDQSTIWLRPSLTLEPGRTYAYLVTDEVTYSGKAHLAQPLGAMLRFSAPLVEDGRSQLPTLSDSEAARLEPVRKTVDSLLTYLEATQGLDRDRVSAAVSFRTMTTMEELLQRRAMLYERQVPTAVTNIETTEPSGAVRLLLNHVETVVRGEMTILDFLDPVTGAFREDGEAVENQIKFALTLPKDVSVVDPLPVVLFGHGLSTSRELLYLIADTLAKEGYAAFAIDLPFHGDRSPCARDSNCVAGSTCAEDRVCRYADGSEAAMIHVEVPYLQPLLRGTQYDELLNYPIMSGELFIDIHDLVGTRDHFAQAYLDLSQAVRVLQGPELVDVVADPAVSGLWIDGEDLVYLGMSLGGILGSGLSALEPKLNDFVLNVPAAHLTVLIENSISFATVFEQAVVERGMERGDDAYFEFINVLRWLLDPIDPLNLVQHTMLQPYSYEDRETGEVIDDRQARALIQMAVGDKVVPNVGTEQLSARMGVPITAYTPTLTDHAFLFNPLPSISTSQARQDMIEFFEGRQ